MRDIVVFSGSAHPAPAKEICAELGVQLSPTRVTRFATDCLEAQLQASSAASSPPSAGLIPRFRCPTSRRT